MNEQITITTVKERKEEIQKQRERIAQRYYGGVCAICKKKKKTMQFHHLEYVDGEKNRKDFSNDVDYWRGFSRRCGYLLSGVFPFFAASSSLVNPIMTLSEISNAFESKVKWPL